MSQPIPPPIQIGNKEWEIVKNILQAHLPHHKVWAFGSRAQNRANKFSDLDLLVETETEIPLGVLADLTDDFSESDLPWTVDVIDSYNCDPAFIDRIRKSLIAVWNPRQE